MAGSAESAGGAAAWPGVADVAVIGGGPAGAVAARLLAHWGHAVQLVEREGGRRALAESLPPSCIPLLAAAGVQPEVEGAGFLRATGNTVWWGGEPMRVEYFPGGERGYQVHRPRFDATLMGCAIAAGANVMRPATALSVQGESDGHALVLEGPAGRLVGRARWVLDCSGRSGLLGRATRTAPPGGLRTIALVREWSCPGGWSLPDESHTLVESTDWGWAWSVPVTPELRFLTLMVDPEFTALGAGPDLERRYRMLLARLPAMSTIARDASPASEVWACDATPYENADVTGRRTLLVGDAASFIDPLSSFGVKKALASAWLAAVVAHTDLVTPAAGSAAQQLYREREREYVAAARRSLRDMSRAAATPSGSGFWSPRASLESDEVESASVQLLRQDPDVLRAFQTLRERGSVRIVPARELRRTSLPIVRGNLVVLEEHLVLADVDTPLRYLRNVDLVAVIDVAAQVEEVGEMYARYVRRLGPVALPDFLGALSVLVGKGGVTLA